MTDSELQKQMNELKNDLKSLQTDVSDLAKILKGLGAERVQEARDSVEEELIRAREGLKRRWGEARAHGKSTVDDLEENIGQHPMSSVLTAFGLGFIIAKLMDAGRQR